MEWNYLYCHVTDSAGSHWSYMKETFNSLYYCSVTTSSSFVYGQLLLNTKLYRKYTKYLQ